MIINVRQKRLIFWTVFYLGLVVMVLGFGFYIKSNLNVGQKSLNGEFVFSLDKQRYQAGESIRFKLANNTDETLKVTNNCPEEPLLVYERTGNTWKRKHLNASDKICSDQNRQIEIKPNSTIGGSYDYWQELFSEPGIYRVVVYVEGYSGIAYQDLEILPKDKTSAQPVQKSAPAPNTQPSPSYPTQADDYDESEYEQEGGEAEYEKEKEPEEIKEVENDD